MKLMLLNEFKNSHILTGHGVIGLHLTCKKSNENANDVESRNGIIIPFPLCWEGSLWFICCVFAWCSRVVAPWVIRISLQNLFVSLAYKTQNHQHQGHQPFVAVNRQKQSRDSLPRGPDINLHVFSHSAWASRLRLRTHTNQCEHLPTNLLSHRNHILYLVVLVAGS